MVARAAYLQARQTQIGLEEQRMLAAVQLIDPLGDGWNRSELPSARDVRVAPRDAK